MMTALLLLIRPPGIPEWAACTEDYQRRYIMPGWNRTCTIPASILHQHSGACSHTRFRQVQLHCSSSSSSFLKFLFVVLFRTTTCLVEHGKGGGGGHSEEGRDHFAGTAVGCFASGLRVARHRRASITTGVTSVVAHLLRGT